jgi:DNA polymerase-3 subunit delta
LIKVIWSQDDLLGAEAVDDIVDAAGSGVEVVHLDAELGIDNLEEAIFAGSLFANERLVVLRNAQMLKKADIERVSTALHSDVPCDVIVVATSERVPTPLIDALKDVAKVDRFPRPRRGEFVNWVSKRMQRSGLKAARDAPATMVEAIGENLRDIAQAIDQLSLRAAGRTVGRNEILEHFTPQAEQPIWVLFDAIVKHDGEKAFATLRRSLAHGDEPLPMLGAIVSSIRGIIRTKSLIEQDPQINEGQIARALGITEGRAGVMRRQSRSISWEWLLQVHRLLAQADFELKGGEDGAVLPPDVVMERVVAGALDAG